MAAKYRKIDTRIWDDERFVQLSAHGKLLALWLLTSERTNRCGFCRYSPALASEQAKIPIEKIQETAHETTNVMDWPFDPKAKVVFFPNWFRYNHPKHSTNLTGALSDLRDIPATPLLAEVHRLKKCLEPRFHEQFDQEVTLFRGSLPPDHASKPDLRSSQDRALEQYQEQYQEQEQKKKVSIARSKQNAAQTQKGPSAKRRHSISTMIAKKEWIQRGWTKEVCKAILSWLYLFHELDPETDLRKDSGRIYWGLAYLVTNNKIPTEIVQVEVGKAIDECETEITSIAGFVRTVVGNRLGLECREPDEGYEEAEDRGLEELEAMLDSVDQPPLYQELLQYTPDEFDKIAV